MSIEIDGRILETDAEGYLTRLEDWSPEAAVAMAKTEGVDLTGDHWEVLHFLRDYYREYAIAPPVRLLTRAIRDRLGADKGNSRYLYGLFPEGPAKQASKFAGLPKPTGCV